MNILFQKCFFLKMTQYCIMLTENVHNFRIILFNFCITHATRSIFATHSYKYIILNMTVLNNTVTTLASSRYHLNEWLLFNDAAMVQPLYYYIHSISLFSM